MFYLSKCHVHTSIYLRIVTNIIDLRGFQSFSILIRWISWVIARYSYCSTIEKEEAKRKISLNLIIFKYPWVYLSTVPISVGWSRINLLFDTFFILNLNELLTWVLDILPVSFRFLFEEVIVDDNPFNICDNRRSRWP